MSEPAPVSCAVGHVHVDGRTRAMTVSHRDLAGTVLHRLELPAEG